MLLLVTGGRGYSNARVMNLSLRRYINPYDRTSMVIQGDCPTGADRLARTWCKLNGVHYASVPALWECYENPAGPIRNGAMLILRPEFVLAFPGGRGTKDMCDQAEAAGIHVERVKV